MASGDVLSPEVEVFQQNGEVEGEVDENFSESPAASPNLNDLRPKLKAKRRAKRSPSKEDQQLSSTNGVNVSQLSRSKPRYDRKSRTAYGRGLPKKGGAGGKGVWGKPGCELDIDGVIDEKDPNYDSDAQGNYELETIAPELTPEEVEKTIKPVIQEYFEHGDTNEVAVTLGELNLGHKKHEIATHAVSMALDKHDSHREMTSRLISDLYGKILTQKEMATAFDSILDDLADLTLDTPDAPHVVGSFIARAVADDVLPPKYVTEYRGSGDSKQTSNSSATLPPDVQAALDRAHVLLSMKHGMVRLDNVWGVGGGQRPVKYLIKKMNMLLREYLSSRDIQEATRCLQELEVPHFHHELVYEAVVTVLEAGSEQVDTAILMLLKSLADAIILTVDQIDRGFDRVFESMPDIVLDVPNAHTVLERFSEECHKEGVITNRTKAKVPIRARKRFVSEGDGGRIKE
ncbi:PREDICTED: programmed cell death protein 4-like isoform X2 [Branchiostoma belcheri]|uniref:Programmed cell death protein 4 n=1 Tax=Branchiostoma belcheri TaxID=7741 RepID=A0A6P5A4D8_BRABE|nr:PREDICTED: programmed cell death protein 4-like isoform X2 [Branchiostoma belcheri]